MNPWLSAGVAAQMCGNTDRQLAETPPPIHFTVYEDAIHALAAKGSRTCLEVGCGVGHGVTILDAAGIHGYTFQGFAFAGIDINEYAIAIARKRYPDARWFNVGADSLPTFEQRDIVVDGSCVLHVEEWRAHLGYLCGAAREAVILHRIPISQRAATWKTTTRGYGQEFDAWCFSLAEVASVMSGHGFAHTETRKADGDSWTLTFRKAVR